MNLHGLTLCIVLHINGWTLSTSSELIEERAQTTLPAQHGNTRVAMLRSSHPHVNIERCQRKLGMGTGEIPSHRIAVSDSLLPDAQWGKENARLTPYGRDVAWGARASNLQWIQIDLGKVMYVSGIITKGVTIYTSQWSGFYWVSEYKVEYKMHATDPMFLEVADGQWGEPKVFQGNENGSNEVKNMFYEPIQMQIVRIVVEDWPRNKNTIAMRLELLGCDIRHDGLSGCGGIHTLTNPAGFISSMNYPLKYDNNANCQWNIIAPKDQVVMLNFEKEISIEEVNNCMMEYVEVIDVIDGRENSIGKLCGKRKPGQYSSTENILKVRFMTDHYETDRGFLANYQFVNSSGCGGPQLLLGETGTFDSGTLRVKGSRENQCSWYVLVGEGELIELHMKNAGVVDSGTEYPPCPATLHIADDVANGKEATFCGNFSTAPYISTKNRVRISFSTTGDHPGTGFHASYRAVAASGCGGVRDLVGPSGVFTTLNHPNDYLENMRCQWNISSHANQTIELSFENFDLEGDRDCRYDYVSIYAGPKQRDFVGKYCGSKTFASPLISNSGMIRVVFVSDKVNENAGFRATYVIRESKAEPPPKPGATTTRQHTTVTRSTTKARPNTTPEAATLLFQTTRTPATTQPATISVKKHVTPTKPWREVPLKTPIKVVTERSRTAPPRPDVQVGTVTEEMVKWIIVGLASVSGLLILLVLLGIILCCRQHFTRVIELNNSANNNHSSILQNYAYDFSIGSTNHSIRSRQVDPPESSQISESISRQGTLRRSTSKDSHIYFSIEECCMKKVSDVKEDASICIEKQHGVQKVHFHAKCQHSSDSSNTRKSSGDGSGTLISEEDIEDEYYEEELDGTSGSDEPDCQACGRTQSGVETCTTTKEEATTGEDPPKKLVDNILYIATDNVI